MESPRLTSDHDKTRLGAPTAARKRHASLKRKGLLGAIPGFMSGRKGGKRRREAAPPAVNSTTSTTPTVERIYKEAYGWDKAEMTGGQVQHKPKVFMDVYDRHFRDGGLRRAAELIQRAYEITTKVRMTSDRAYTGMPFSGGDPERAGHLNLSQQDRLDLEMLARTVDKLTRINPVWWNRIKDHILREPDINGRFPSVNELGAEITDYKKGSDNATAAGVAAVIDALIAFEIARQESAIELHMRDDKRRKEMEKMLEEHARRERGRRRVAS